MNGLLKALDDYLALRRNMGFKLAEHEPALRKFIAFLNTRNAESITTNLALAWAQQPRHTTPATRAKRLGMVRDFARYLCTTDPRTQVPPQGLLPAQPQRTQPYIYTQDQICRLVQQAARLDPADGLRPHTFSTLFGLLAVTGMRIGEAMALDRRDVDLKEGVITVRLGKFNKTRLLPVHRSTRRRLHGYAQSRDSLVRVRASESFFLTDTGRRLYYERVWRAFARVSWQTGLRPTPRGHGPRIHDLRHTFAVRTLINWYRSGINPEQRLPSLSAYLGHAKVSDTYWYLSAVPELMGAVSSRLDNLFGATS